MLAGRVAIVTGGTGALGQAITLRLLADGAVVCVPWIVGGARAAQRPRRRPPRATPARGALRRHRLRRDDALAERSASATARSTSSCRALGGFAGGASSRPTAPPGTGCSP